MVVTDPVYERREMSSWSEGLLPIAYYIRCLALIGAEEIKVSLFDDYTNKKGRVIDVKLYESTEIPPGGMATIEFKVNGVSLTIHLLTEDMTKFHLDTYDILGLGRPTPYNPEETEDPRYSQNFPLKAIGSLATKGIVVYHEDDFRFLPPYLPPEVFGFRIVHSSGGAKIIQKVVDVKDRLQAAFETETAIREALGALAGYLPGDNSGFFEELNQYQEGQRKITIEDVIQAYRQRLNRIAKFIKSLPSQEAQSTLKRINFLFMAPIATDGKIDKQKIQKIHEAPNDPDNPRPSEYYRRPYFGSPNQLINEHNEGKINIFEYYDRIIREFYDTFPQLKKSGETKVL